MKIINKNKGMTLIEILLALLLLSIVAVPLGKFFMDSFKFQSRSQRNTQANKAAEYVVEALKNGQAIDLVDGEEHELLLSEFYAKLEISTNKKYIINIKSAKVSSDLTLEGDTPTSPEYQGNIRITDSGIETSGDINMSMSNGVLVITAGYEENNILIENDTDLFSEIGVRNLSGKTINIYKVSGVTLNVLEGNIYQANVDKNGVIQNNRYSLYKVIVTATEESDTTIVSTVETTVRIKI